jgi:hypothetical protein
MDYVQYTDLFISLVKVIKAVHLRLPVSHGALNEQVPRMRARRNLLATSNGKIDFIASVMG